MDRVPSDKERWQAVLQDLSQQIQGWVSHEKAKGLDIEHRSLPGDLGDPLAEIIVGGKAVFFLEAAEFAEGRVPTIAFLYAYPSLRRVQLRGPIEGQWEVLSRDGIPMKYRWNSHGFFSLLADLADVPNAKGA